LLNADGGFRFGSSNVEIDLLCPALRIAIEVDGYFHFQDNSAYRRDRAKDFLMQAEGMLVLRFLAEDVIDRLNFILADIFKAVKIRQNRTEG
jgi:very-short-patch-repair endonuclease